MVSSFVRTSSLNLRIMIAAVPILGFVTEPALAQTMTFEEFQAKVNESAGEIARYQQVLQNPDARVQYQAVQLMLKSKDPALVRIAKEHALFSTNPVLRNSAIKSIFDTSDNFRVSVSATGESSAKIFQWILKKGGSHDGRSGTAIIGISGAASNCWINSSKQCILKLVGTTVQLRTFGNYSDKAQAALDLGSDGVLRGVVYSEGGSANISIDLKE